MTCLHQAWRRVRRVAAAVAIVLALPLASPASFAQTGEIDRDQPALISADRLTYDEALGIVTASGNVEISQGQRVLRADSVTYNQRTQVVTASGNVALLEATGDVLFADYVELSDDLAEGFVRDVRLLLADRSRMAANRAVKVADGRTVLSQGVYSPCELCREDPTHPPLWQIKARRVIHDAEDKVVRYNDARLEMFGVPVLYTPYFEHPDWTVDRQSGLLAPTFGSTDFIGSFIDIPYYWNIAPEQDATFTLRPTTEQNVQVFGQYRHLLSNGRYQFDGSATIADRIDQSGRQLSNEFRGHIEGSGRFDIDPVWRWGFDVARASDDTYLRVYDISTEDNLTSRLFAEGLHGRNYMAANGFTYQALRSGTSTQEQPIVAPLLDVNYLSEPGAGGGVYSLDANVMLLNRLEGRQSRRLSLVNGWELPFSGPIGDVYRLRARLQTDAYFTDGVDPDSDAANPADGDNNEFTGRIFPQLALEARYPWVSDYAGARQTFEPIAQLVLAPPGMNPGAIPDEDSEGVEFDTSNLFRLNRFPGRDRVDSGSRVDYGIRYGLELEDGLYTELVFGQSYRFDDSAAFEPGSGLENQLSDYVGKLEVRPIPQVDLGYSFRLDKDNLEPRRHEVFGRVGVPMATLSGSYLFTSSGLDTASDFDRNELALRLSSRLTENWSAFISGRHDFRADRTLENAIGLTYQDECFRISGIARRQRFRDRDIEPEDSFFLTVSFKNIGEFGG